MTNNGLGWLRLRPITDGRRIKPLLMNSGISVVTPIYNQPSVDIATQSVDTVQPSVDIATQSVDTIVELTGDMLRSPRAHAEVALMQIKLKPKGAPPPSVGVGRVAKLTGVEILRRMHVVLGHPSLPVLLATLMASKDVNAHIITKADIASSMCARRAVFASQRR